MCAEPPSVMFECRRNARKEHRCCECRRTICRGDLHEYVKGLWDGLWSEFRTCLFCCDLRAEALKRAEAAYGINACMPAFGYLREEFETAEWRARQAAREAAITKAEGAASNDSDCVLATGEHFVASHLTKEEALP